MCTAEDREMIHLDKVREAAESYTYEELEVIASVIARKNPEILFSALKEEMDYNRTIINDIKERMGGIA